MPTGAPGGEGEEQSGQEAAAAGPEAVAGTSGVGASSVAEQQPPQQVALAEITTADQLKAMGLCDTLIILGDTAHGGAQPVSLVSSLEPVQCLTAGTAEAVARAAAAAGGGNLVLCLPEDTLALEVAASGQEGAHTWAWLQHDPSAAGVTGVNEAVVRASSGAPVVVSATPALAGAPGEMLLVMDSSAEDSVGLAAKSWFNDSVIATQALLTLEAHK